MVWFVERPYVRTHKDEDYNKAELIVAKHRNGSVRDIPLYFEPSITTFYNAMEDGGGEGGDQDYQYDGGYDSGSDMGATGFGDY